MPEDVLNVVNNETREYYHQCEEIQRLNESNTRAMMKNEDLYKQMDAMQTHV